MKNMIQLYRIKVENIERVFRIENFEEDLSKTTIVFHFLEFSNTFKANSNDSFLYIEHFLFT